MASTLRRPKRRPISFRPSLERLEDRTLLSSTIPLSDTSWTTIGPAPIAGPYAGRVTGVAADPTNANVIYIATAGSGVWKTTNGGNSWAPLTDNLNLPFPIVPFMGAIAVAPGSANIIYAGTGEANYGSSKVNIFRDNIYYGQGILKSTDGGATWVLEGNSLFNRRTFSRIVVDPTNANVVYAAVGAQATNGLPGNAGIWKTTDGGVNWTDMTASISSTAAFSDLVMDPTNSQVLYAAVGDPFMSDTANGVYKTTDGGTTWARAGNFPTGFDPNVGRITIAIAPSNHLVLYGVIAQEAGPGVAPVYQAWKTTDGGNTWTQMNAFPGIGQYIDYNTSLGVDPSNQNLVYAGGQAGVFVVSSDGGASWSNIGFKHGDDHAITFNAAGQLLAGDDGGIWRWDASAQNWADLNSNLGTLQLEGGAIDPVNPNFALAGAQDNGTEIFTDNLAWQETDGGDGGKVLWDFTNTQTVYHDAAVASFGPDFFVEKSTDGGHSWFPVTNGLNAGAEPTIFYPPFVMDPGNSSRLFLGTSRVYETTDGGNSWTPISTPGSQGWTVSTSINAIAVSRSAPGTIYATAGGHIFVTTNDGGMWAQVDVPGFSDHFGGLFVDPSNNLVAYAVRDRFTGGPKGHVFKTTDGGAHWLDVSGNLPDVPTNVILLDPRTGGLYAGTDTGLYGSPDGGQHWSVVSQGLPNVRVIQLELNPTLNILAATTNGRGMWELTSTRLVVLPSANPVGPGVPFTATAEALDPLGTVIPGYTGTVHFTSSDTAAGVVVPSDYTFTAADNGVHTFTSGFTLQTNGAQTITATDKANPSVTGSAVVVVGTAASVTHFTVTAPVVVTPGTAFTVTVQALDANNQVDPAYTGTVHFTSSDVAPGVVLPADYTFTAQDAGVHTFTLGVTLQTLGNQTVTATDTSNSTVTGTANVQVASQLPAGSFGVSPNTFVSTAGSPFSVTVTALDSNGNVDATYTGTVHFSSTDPRAFLPANYTFTAQDNGVHTFANVTLFTAGNQTTTVTDVLNSAVQGVGSIQIQAAALSGFSVTGFPSPVTAGTPGTFTVAALDVYGNVVQSYGGTVHFSSSDPLALLPGNGTLPNGTGTFSATLKTAGVQSITVTDTAHSNLRGSQTGIIVHPAAVSRLVVTAPGATPAGQPFALTVTAEDVYGNTTPAYAGTIKFTSSDTKAVLPPNYQFLASDQGVHTFSVTLQTGGNQTVTATDTVNSSLTGGAIVIVVAPMPATHFQVNTSVASARAGVAFTVTVTALDVNNNVAQTYLGTVHFTSNDPQAVLPGDYVFTAQDGGVHTFTNLVTLKTVGSRTVVATDKANASITGFASLPVVPGTVAGFGVTGFPTTVAAGTQGSFTVTAQDAYGNTVPTYVGTVVFSSNDPKATLPARYTFRSTDFGAHSFTAVLRSAGLHSLTATDTANSAVTGSQTNILVGPGTTAQLGVSAATGQAAGTAFSVTVTSQDAFGNVSAGYTGRVHFSSSDNQAVLPADYTFVAADNGVHTFTGVILKTAGGQSLTATDTASGSVTGTVGLVVLAGAPDHFALGAPPTLKEGVFFSAPVVVRDLFNNTVTSYRGTVHFTSTDPFAGLPLDYAFTAGDAGTHTFSVALRTPGTQTLSVADTAAPTVRGSAGVKVTAFVTQSLAPAGNVLYAVTSTHALVIFAGGVWTQVGAPGTVDAVSAVVDGPTGQPVAFVVSSSQGLLRYSPGGGWAQLGAAGTVQSITAGTDVAGRAQVYVVTANNALAELSPSFGWIMIGGPGSVLSASAVSQDRVAVITADRSLFQYSTRAGWQRLSGAGFASSASAVAEASGNLVVFLVTTNHALFRFDASSGWLQIGGANTILAASAGTDTRGRADVFVVANDDSFDEFNVSSGWAPELPRGSVLSWTAGNADHVFAVTADRSIFEHDPVFGWFMLADQGFGLG